MTEENIPQTPRIRKCPECGSNRLMRDYECAEIVCMGCGVVVAAQLADQGPEWRAFDDEQRLNAPEPEPHLHLQFTIKVSQP